MSDTWEDIQAVKNKRNSLRERLEKRKKERQDILGTSAYLPSGGSPSTSTSFKSISLESTSFDDKNLSFNTSIKYETVDVEPDFEKTFLQILNDRSLILPINSKQIAEKMGKVLRKSLATEPVHYYIQKYSMQQIIR